MYRLHGCSCDACIDCEFTDCKHLQFAGPWLSAMLSFHPLQINTAQIEFEKDIRKQLLHHTASLMSPFFCLAVEEGVQWPQVLLVMPMAKIWTKTMQAYALRRVHPLPNDYDHTKVEMPAEHCLCPKMFAACNKRHICETNGKLHLQSIQIKNVLAVALCHTPKKVQSAFTKTECGNFELNQTKEATKIRDSFQLHRKLFFDDYYLLDTSATHTL